MIVLANHDVVAIRPSSLSHVKKFCVGLKRSLRTPPGSGEPQTRRRCAASDEVWVKTNSVLHNALIDAAQEHEQVIWLYL